MQDGSSLTAPNGIDQAQFEADKRAVYKHPLFSLLALMLEKCEQATQGYVSSSASTSSSSSGNSREQQQHSSGSPNGGGAANGGAGSDSNVDSFSRDVQAFVHLLEKEKRPLLTNNAELDGLMIKALQVLRIHLLELEKVQELCRDFCTRYIACLRGKMQSENLLRSDYPLEHNNNMSNSNSPVNNNSPEQEPITPTQPPVYFGGAAAAAAVSADYLSGGGGVGGGPIGGSGVGIGVDANDFSSIQGAYNIQNNNSASESSFGSHNGPTAHTSTNSTPNHNNNHSASSSSASDPAAIGLGIAQPPPSAHPLQSDSSNLHMTHQQQQQHLHQQHQQHLQQQQQHQHLLAQASSSTNPAAAAAAAAALLSPQMLGSTPLNQIGCASALGLGDPFAKYADQLSPCGSSDGEGADSELDSNCDDLSSNFSSTSGSKRHKRGILPKQATSVMRAWLFQHLVHPYPTEDEKRTIAAQTNLTLLQVNNWFINARRRILQPMLEHASDSSSSTARKKSSPSASSTPTPSKQQQQQQRFWADTSCSGNSPLQMLQNPAMIDPNIENISANVNRQSANDTERLAVVQKMAAAAAAAVAASGAAGDGPNSYYSSDDSNDSLVIDHDT